MARVLYRLASFSAANRWKVVTAWVAVLLVAAVATISGMQFSDAAFEIPGTDSARAQNELAREFPGGDTEDQEQLQLVFQVPSGAITDPEPAAIVASAIETAGRIDHVVAVSNPFAETSPAVSPDGQVAIATVTFQGLSDDADLEEQAASALDQVAEEARSSGMTVEVGGALVQQEASAVGGLPSSLVR